jgi:hypothetical protein
MAKIQLEAFGVPFNSEEAKSKFSISIDGVFKSGLIKIVRIL